MGPSFKMVREDKSTWKANYFVKIQRMLEEYPRCFLVSADNVGSLQMQQIRLALRGKGEVLMGKNTMMRKAIRGCIPQNPDLERLLPHVVGNIGFVFTKEDLTEIRTILESNKKEAPAKAGAIAPKDVFIEKGNTGMGPEKTSFFQALSIPTKITKGTIEILNEVNLIKEGDKVGSSESTLLNMLNISPFTYGLLIENVYDSGTIFSPSILNITNEDIIARFMSGVRNIAAISLQIGYPTAASVPHSLINGFKKLLAIAVETDIDFEEANQTKEYLKDPSKFAVAAVAAAPAAEAKKEEAKKEESEESDDDMGFGLFD